MRTMKSNTKQIILLAATAMIALSASGCIGKGKGKAPPPPVEAPIVRKG